MGSVTSTISINVNCKQRQLMVVYEVLLRVALSCTLLASPRHCHCCETKGAEQAEKKERKVRRRYGDNLI